MSKRARSPNYPSIGIEKAIGFAKKLHAHERKHEAPKEVVFGHWGYSEKSSSALRVLGALKAYGLVKVKGGKVGLSDRGLRIVLDEREVSPERDAAICAASLEPFVFRTMGEIYKGGLPSDATIRTDLRLEHGFASEAAANGAIRVYKDNLEFTSTLDGGKVADESEEPNGTLKEESEHLSGSSGDHEIPDLPEVGDLVQWTSQGVDQFVEPRRVRAVQEHEGKMYVFVDGTESGCPAPQVTVVQKAPKETTVTLAAETTKPPVLPLPAVSPPTSTGTDALSLSVPFRGKTLSVQVRAQGEPLRSYHVDKIIAHLELAKDDLDFEGQG